MTTDYRALAEELRHRVDRLEAELPMLEGWEREEAEDGIAHVHLVRDAIARGDYRAVEELLRRGSAKLRMLRPERDKLN